MPPRQGNGMAVTSLITGFLGFCIPFFGGALAILFGFLGIKRSKVSNSGKGLAIAGLILGVLSIGMYAVFGGTFYSWWKGTEVNRALASQFIKSVDSGNLAQATSDADTSALNLAVLAVELKSHGNVKDVTVIMAVPEGDRATIAGIIDFGGTQKAFEMKQRKIGETWKVTALTIKDK
jgi:hypothetical protein